MDAPADSAEVIHRFDVTWCFNRYKVRFALYIAIMTNTLDARSATAKLPDNSSDIAPQR